MSEEMREVRRTLDAILPLVQETHEAVYGNGEVESGLKFRVTWLERQLGQVPTWRWLVDKALLPLVFAGLGYFLASVT